MPNWKKVAALPPVEQIPLYRAHLERKPRDAAIWFDLGLAYKKLRDWPACADANSRALRIESHAGDPAWWNLAIAVTALRDWKTARLAWRGFGISGIPDGDGPFECDFGTTPLRLPNGEVVWGTRLDPARIIVRNIPLPDSTYRWGDVMLNDGVPNGERVAWGRTFAVLDAIERWSPSEIPTFSVDVTCTADSDASALVDLFESNHFAAEDWSTSVRHLCAECSRGNPGTHDHPFPEGETRRSFGLASPLGLADRLLAEWRDAAPHRRAYENLAPADAGS